MQLLVKAEDYREYFEDVLEQNSSWQVEFSEDGVDLILRVNTVRNLEGHSRIVYTGGREIDAVRGKEYPLGGVAPYTLHPLRAYTIVSDVILKKPLPVSLLALVLPHTEATMVVLGGQWKTDLRLHNGQIAIDIMSPLAMTLGAMVPFAAVRFFKNSTIEEAVEEVPNKRRKGTVKEKEEVTADES